jgi:pimeloyl-ACP methyl ester carboxylesterase
MVAFTVTAVLLPGTAAQAAEPAGAAPSRINWQPCGSEFPDAECGTLAVPVDWSRPRGAKIDLALARRKATNPGARIGSLVVNPGGPGGSGVSFVLQAPDYFSEALRSRFDLVGFDPRGVARSHPVVCSLDLLQQQPSPVLTSQADFDRVVAYNRRLAADCRAHTGPLIDHVDTLSVVHDLDAIRAALGERRLTYYGISYGTLIGQQYAQTYPGRVRALTLDSNMDHSLGTAAFLATESWTAQDSFDEFVKGCKADNECVLADRNIRAFWADLLARAARGELVDPTFPEFVLTPYNLIEIAFGSFYGPDWRGLAEFLVAVDEGSPTAALSTATGRRGFAQETAENPFQAVFCQDWRLPLRNFAEYSTQLRIQRAIAPDMRYSPLALFAVVACLGWTDSPANPQHPLRVRGSETLLVLNALHDPATGYLWGVNAARQLGRAARFVTYEGWGHGVYGQGACPTSIVDNYLISGALPPNGKRCPAVSPVDVAAQRTRALPLPTTAPRW